MSLLRRRALVAATALGSVIAPFVAAPAADAHTCAKVSIWVAGTERVVGGCHLPPGDPGDLCTQLAVTPAGTGVGFVACVHLP